MLDPNTSCMVETRHHTKPHKPNPPATLKPADCRSPEEGDAVCGMEVLDAHGDLVEWPLSWTGTAPVRPATQKQQVQPQLGGLPGLGQGG